MPCRGSSNERLVRRGTAYLAGLFVATAAMLNVLFVFVPGRNVCVAGWLDGGLAGFAMGVGG